MIDFLSHVLLVVLGGTVNGYLILVCGILMFPDDRSVGNPIDLDAEKGLFFISPHKLLVIIRTCLV